MEECRCGSTRSAVDGLEPRFSSNKRQGYDNMWLGRYESEINLLPLTGVELRFLGRPALSVVTIPTDLQMYIFYTIKFFIVLVIISSTRRPEEDTCRNV